MARLITEKLVTATTGWEVVYATESALPRGTEAFIDSVIVSNPTGGTIVADFAIADSSTATPTTGELINSSQISVGAGVVAKALFPDSTNPVAKLAIGRGQTLMVKGDAAGLVVRAFGSQGAEDTLVGLQLVG